MKITIEHYEHIALALDSIQPRIIAAIPEYKKAGLSNERLRWDCIRATGLIPWLCDNIYSYANDDHIDTALRVYFKKLGVNHA
jgi:hypothetical protein